MSAHNWFYISDSVIGTSETIGPIEEEEILRFARDGKLARKTLVSSPSRTNNSWYPLERVPGLLNAFEIGDAERQQSKANKAAEEARRRQQTEARHDAARLQEQQSRAAESAQIAQISDCQDIELVKSICEKVGGILTGTETIQFVTVQNKVVPALPVVNFTPDAVIVTNRRLIFFRPKLFGRFEFQDYLWYDLFNAHLQQNMFGSVFSAQHVRGMFVSMDYLSKQAAQTLYRIAQEREESARLARHQVNLDTLRAGAAQVNVQTNVPIPAAPANSPFMLHVPTSSHDEIAKKLESLKSLLEKGLITKEDLDQRKRELLAQI